MSDELNKFTKSWEENPSEMFKAFVTLKEHLESIENLELTFVGRPGVTYSLRAKHQNQKDRNLFGMLDVIDDDPDDRWLSICFYEDYLTDPNEMGDMVPGGLAGDDAYCFDLDEFNEGDVKYLAERLTEASKNAAL
ncbi:MAG: hypothetical protein GY714_22860 [Desulfobacterales bacterium]|nr:hypothetical protein [Desulfobacterales bacterium]MCP4162264.1 hypothetical protein [Deltaproteobacteria bacterium]